MTESTHREPPLSRLVGRRPNRGAADAARVVLADVQALVRAELNLAKAEVAEGAKHKVMGAGFFIGAAIIGWLAIQVFLVFLGFLFALFLPGWAAVGLVLLLLVIAIGILGYLGMQKMKKEAGISTAKASIEASKQAASAAVEQAKANTKQGVDDAKATLAETAAEVKGRVTAGRGSSGEATVPAVPAASSTTQEASS